MKYYKIKRKYYILITILLILFLFVFFFINYSNNMSKKIVIISKERFEKSVYNNLNKLTIKASNYPNLDLISKIYKNKNDEIIYIDYNMTLLYEFINYIKDNLLESVDTNYIFNVPFFAGSNNIFLNNIGPKVTTKVSFIDNMMVSFSSRVVDYGLNNALLELYIKLNIEANLITPINEDKVSIEYNLLISSKVINGRVPNYIGSYPEKLFNIPFNT